jgi:hypothetical protein
MGRHTYHADIMAWLVEESGGVCASCGGTEHLAFHHLTLGDKNFSVCEQTDRPIEELLAEVHDCLLLCYHCHFSHHAGIDYGVGHRIVTRRTKYKEARNVAFSELMRREGVKRQVRELKPQATAKTNTKKRRLARQRIAELQAELA